MILVFDCNAETSALIVTMFIRLVGVHRLGGQRTLEPETMLISKPPINCPFTRPGLSAIFRCGARIVPSTLALQQVTPPPPPLKATSGPVPRILYKMWLGVTPPEATILPPPVNTNLFVTLKKNISDGPPLI